MCDGCSSNGGASKSGKCSCKSSYGPDDCPIHAPGPEVPEPYAKGITTSKYNINILMLIITNRFYYALKTFTDKTSRYLARMMRIFNVID